MENEKIDFLHQKYSDLVLPSEFEIVEALAEGGQGIVFKARNTILDRIVVVKIIKSDQSEDMARQLARIEKEAKILARLKHENIVQIFQFGRCGEGSPFLVCEYIEGCTLQEMLAKDTRFSDEEIIDLFSQLLSALSYAHKNGLIHRDLKPGNIMISKDGDRYSVKLLDFGIAREYEIVADGGLTGTTSLSGSPAYMSPEQCSGEALDPRSDLYSLACVLYECLFMEPPFQAESACAVQYKQIHEPTDSLSGLAERPELVGFFKKALAKERQMRFESAAVFQEEMLKALRNERKAGQKRNPFVIAVVLVLIAIAIFEIFSGSFYRQESVEMKTGKAAPAKKKVTMRRSLESSLQDVCSKVEDHRGWALDRETLEDLHVTLGELLPLCRNPKLKYVANYLDAEIMEALDYPLEAQEKAIDEALKCCKIKGKETREAAQCYFFKSRLARNRNQRKACLANIRKAQEILEESKGADNPYILGIPTYLERVLDLRLEYKLCFTEAEEMFDRKEYDNAKAKFSEAERFGREFGTMSRVPSLIRKADIDLLLNKRDKAGNELKRAFAAISNEEHEPHRAIGEQRAMLMIVNWFYRNGCKADAVTLLEEAVKFMEVDIKLNRKQEAYEQAKVALAELKETGKTSELERFAYGASVNGKLKESPVRK